MFGTIQLCLSQCWHYTVVFGTIQLCLSHRSDTIQLCLSHRCGTIQLCLALYSCHWCGTIQLCLSQCRYYTVVSLTVLALYSCVSVTGCLLLVLSFGQPPSIEQTQLGDYAAPRGSLQSPVEWYKNRKRKFRRRGAG